VNRFEEAFTIVRLLLQEGHVDFSGRFVEARDLPLVPPPARPGGPPLMVGSIGPRMLSITLPHVQAWNAWGPWFGNSVAGYGAVREQVDAACRAAGRDPAEVERTVALVVALPGALGRGSAVTDEPFDPISGEPGTLSATLRTFAQLGVAHVQLVLDPITVESIAALAPTLAALDG
jgi:alkanesulfonate monooxygenase SsuD/methylene tetrahydromethanopterin reductase-like flavin-dependent oxidoreductase (luciferase family)